MAGKSYRKGISLIEAVEMFSDPDFTEAWFVEQRWPDGVACPDCGSLNIQHRRTRKPQPFRCNDCCKDFSVKTGTIMHASKLPLKAWGIAMYILVTNLKGVSSMKLHRDLGVTQKTAWHLGQPHPQGMGERYRPVQRPRGSGRNLGRWEGAEQARVQEADTPGVGR